ncbi:MAG: protein kinase domain-containing protein [Planctomycetota bacterium]
MGSSKERSGTGERGKSTTIDVGMRLGDLVVVREIGRGGQGIVFEARQESVQRTVAVKVLPREVTASDAHRERFHREAEAAARLNHPNIVALHGFQEWEGHLLIVAECVRGGSLEDALVEERWGDEHADDGRGAWAAEICRQLADGLQHAHEHGVIHRDIKPGNVLLTEDGVPKITDFGLAKVEDDRNLSRTGMLVGTPNYMSPEQVAGGRGGLDARSDVYSLGAVLYKLLTGEVPFTNDSLQGLLLDILTRAPVPPRKLDESLDPDLEAVCLKALEKAPQDRYPSAEALRRDLERFLQGQPTAARPLSRAARALRSMRRLATSTLAVAAILIPTAWLAVDALLLRPLAGSAGPVHVARMALAAAATVLFAWPLALLGARIARGRRLGMVSAWVLAALVGAGALAHVNEDWTRQRHLADRRALQRQVGLGERRDVRDIARYVSAWEHRFTPDDLVLVARAFLERERPAQAEPWARRMEAIDAASPVSLALMSGVYESLGYDDQAREADTRLWSAQGGDANWIEWAQAGDILRELDRHGEALRAYETGAARPGADLGVMNLALAGINTDLCRWEEAGKYLDYHFKLHPEDTAAHVLALRLAKHEGDWEVAERHLTAIEADPLVPVVAKLSHHRGLLESRGEHAEAIALVREAHRRHRDDPRVVEWCARMVLEEGERVEGLARSETGSAQQERFAEAQRNFEDARDHYARLGVLEQDSVVALVGQSAANIQLAPYDKEREANRYADAEALAERAVELDPAYWEAHYNRGLAVRLAARTVHGATRNMPLDVLETVVEPMVAALEANGLSEASLNNAAYALGCVYRITGDAATLHQALEYARRAVLRSDPSRTGSDCPPGPQERGQHSNRLDTLRELHEIGRDHAAALRTAELALAALAPGDAQFESRREVVERLRGADVSDR